MRLANDVTRCDSKVCPDRDECARHEKPKDLDLYSCFVQDPYLLTAPQSCRYFIQK